MKLTRKAPTCLAAVLLMAVGAVTSQGAAPALQGRLTLRPLTPSDIGDYKLTGNQGASGLNTIGVGQPAYLDALVNVAVPASDITNVTWQLAGKPVGSAAVITNSPLGTNVPIYHPVDRVMSRIAGRAFLRPDVRGQYQVTATVETASSGTTNVTQTINAGVYMGVQTCELCHSGGAIAENISAKWSQTLHATKFSRSIDGLVGSYSKSCVSCHTVGYDVNPLAVNGGFDDLATQAGWTFPTNLAAGNFAAMPANLKNVANIQCENCHGPGSEHAYNLGDTSRISKTFSAGDCGQCHDAKSHHIKNPEWNNSRHAIATRTPSGPSRINCVRCHTAGGFKDYVEHLGSTATYATNTVYEAISCTACHDPHDATNPHQLRTGPEYTLGDGTKVNAGMGGLCLNCHHTRNGAAATNVQNYQQGKATWAGGSSFGVHDSSQGDMVMGVNAITYGKEIPSGAHGNVENLCVGCHMQEVASTDPGFTKVGGHTFAMSYNVVTNGVTNIVDQVEVCVSCHGPMEEFNAPRKDYNGDGVIEGVQTEVQKLLEKLSTLVPNSTYRADGIYVADGLVKSSLSTKTNWQSKFLNAAYNWQFVNADGSKGIHNAPFAVGLLKASIADLTGDANNDGLPDAWQTQYFGSTSSANAAASACPAGDGVPNWLKYSLGLDPMVAGINVQGGVVWANGKGVVNPGGTNTVAIYTAAEVAFDTEVGKTYQLQAISSLGGGWSNVGAPIVGTGSQMSYVTPTRANVQQFYRVATTTP